MVLFKKKKRDWERLVEHVSEDRRIYAPGDAQVCPILVATKLKMTTSAAAAAAARDKQLDELRALMAAHSPPIHALLVPSEDAHQVGTLVASLIGTDHGRSDPVSLDYAGFRFFLSLLFYLFIPLLDE
jgi:hypothetical protein